MPLPTYNRPTLSRGVSVLNNIEEVQDGIYTTISATGDIRRNLVYNCEFTRYANQTGTSNWYDYQHPDGWIFTCDGTTPQIGYDSTEEACRILTPADATSMVFSQALHEFPRWQTKLRGKRVTVSVLIKGSSNVTVSLADGVATVSQALAGTGSAERVELTIVVNAAATILTLTVSTSAASEAIYVYQAYGNLGEIALPDLPCQIGEIGLWQGMDETYPETVMECSAASSLIEIPAGYTRLESWLNGRFGRGANSRSYLPELRGRFLRVWAHGSTQDPDRATRTNRGDGTTGDKVGTLQANQNLSHGHSMYGGRQTSSNKVEEYELGYYDGVSPMHINANEGGYLTAIRAAGGNQSNPNNINVLAGIRWA